MYKIYTEYRYKAQQHLKKSLPVKKIITFLIVGACMQVSAATIAQNITLVKKNISLKAVFEEINKQTGYNIFGSDMNQFSKTINVDFKNTELDQVLAKCLENTTLSYKIEGKTIIIKKNEKSQNFIKENTNKPGAVINDAAGKVTDLDGKPLSNVSIKVKGTDRGGITSASGQFSVSAKQGDVLIFSMVGYNSIEVVVKSGDPITVVLSENINSLNQVVVSALGISKEKRKLGYATTTVNGSLLNEAKEPNIASSLEGRVAGLNINTATGGPGSSARILIRGVSNFSSGNVGPLFVIDGVPMDNTQQGTVSTYGGSDQGDGISSINPDDIESVTVLKGSTASALYGARSANGVILITTKSGKNTKGIGVEFSSNFSINHPVNLSDFQNQYGAGQHGVIPESLTALINNDGFNSWGPKFNGQQAIGFDGKMHLYAPVSNGFRQFYRDAPLTTNTVAISHGGENGNIRFSLSQTNNQSIIPNSGLKRYSANVKLNQNISSKLKLSAMANFIHEEVKNRPFLNDFTRNSNFTVKFLPPNFGPNDLKSGWDPITGREMLIDATGYYENPWFAAYKLINNTSRNRFITSTSLRYDIAKEFYAQVRIGLDYIVDNTLQIYPTGWGENQQGGLGDQAKQETTELNMDALVGYTHHFTKKFNIDASVGGNIRKNQVERLGYYNQNWVEPFVYTVANSNGLTADYKFTKAQTNSSYYSLDFNFDRYLTLSTTGRADWFSTVTNNPTFTPSASASFLFHDLLNLPKMSFGKLRASYAQTSAEALPYRTQITYLPQGIIAGLPFGYPQSSVFNPNEIRAYKMKEFELGLEMKFFENRFGLDATYFNRKTYGELINDPIDPASGFANAYLPLGATSNKGVELELRGSPVSNKNFNWNINFNFTYVTNKLVSLGSTKGSFITLNQYTPATGGTTNAGDGSFIADVQGYPLSQIMINDYKRDGKGNIVVANGIPEKGNLIPYGSGIPKIYGGINNEFNYKHFSLSFLIDYRFKVKVESGTNFESIYYGLNKNTLAGRETGVLFKGVNEDGTPNTQNVDAQTFYQGILNNGISINEVFDASFIKLRQLTLGYDIPLPKGTIKSIKVSLAGRNLWTILKHTPNFDPESQYSSTLENAGLEGGSLPPVVTYGVNLSVKF